MSDGSSVSSRSSSAWRRVSSAISCSSVASSARTSVALVVQLGEPCLPGRLARGVADERGRRLVPGAAQDTVAEAAAAADPDRRVALAEPDGLEQPVHVGLGHAALRSPIAGTSAAASRGPAARAVDCGEQHVLGIGVKQLARRGDPAVEDPRRLQRRLDPGAIVGRDAVAEVEKLPQRRARAQLARVRGPGVRDGRRGVYAGLQLLDLALQLVAGRPRLRRRERSPAPGRARSAGPRRGQRRPRPAPADWRRLSSQATPPGRRRRPPGRGATAPWRRRGVRGLRVRIRRSPPGRRPARRRAVPSVPRARWPAARCSTAPPQARHASAASG